MNLQQSNLQTTSPAKRNDGSSPGLIFRLQPAVLKFITLTVPALLALVVFLEIVTRLTLEVSDYPDSVHDPILGRHFVPNQQGRYIKGLPTEINARYSINANGWNSPQDYRERDPDTLRIAVIGDSFVEALQVDVGQAYPDLIQQALNSPSSKRDVEVYSYGHSGANLAHYLGVLRHHIAPTRPDVVIVNIVPNDFKESLHPFALRGFWSLLRKDEGYEMVPPSPHRGLFAKRAARHSAFARFLMLNASIEAKWRAALRALSRRQRLTPAARSAMAVNSIGGQHEVHRLLTHVFSEFETETTAIDSQLLLVFDGNRPKLYREPAAHTQSDLALIEIALTVATELDLDAIDLHPVFAGDWQESRRRFDWPSDGHWNERAHRLVGGAVVDWLVRRGFTSRREGPAVELPVLEAVLE